MPARQALPLFLMPLANLRVFGSQNITVLNAEERFLEHLERLHQDFPKLRVVLEHVTSAAAVEKVRAFLSGVQDKSCG